MRLHGAREKSLRHQAVYLPARRGSRLAAADGETSGRPYSAHFSDGMSQGSAPTSIVTNTTPLLHKSACCPRYLPAHATTVGERKVRNKQIGGAAYFFLARTSGATYGGVPQLRSSSLQEEKHKTVDIRRPRLPPSPIPRAFRTARCL